MPGNKEEMIKADLSSRKRNMAMIPRIFPAVLAVTLALAAYASPQAGDDAWLAKVRRDYPRMFFNADTWPAIKTHTLSDPAARAAADGEERIWQIQHLF